VVTRKYQVTIPKEVREELRIKVGDNVVFVKEANGKYHVFRVEGFTREFCEGCKDIEKTIAETREGLGKGVEKQRL
jgi:AbrB family looped-hinge helix DNA binding protein